MKVKKTKRAAKRLVARLNLAYWDAVDVKGGELLLQPTLAITGVIATLKFLVEREFPALKGIDPTTFLRHSEEGVAFVVPFELR